MVKLGFKFQRPHIQVILKAPIISMLQGVDIYFFLMGSMVDTCIDWVSHEAYDEDHTLPQEIEMSIWRKHNPGIFMPGA